MVCIYILVAGVSVFQNSSEIIVQSDRRATTFESLHLKRKNSHQIFASEKMENILYGKDLGTESEICENAKSFGECLLKKFEEGGENEILVSKALCAFVDSKF